MKPQYIRINALGNTEYFSDKEMCVRHREDGPAMEHSNGDKFWYQNDKLHRLDGPAMEWSNGSTFWCRNGEYHREDGPAIEYENGNKSWYLDGVYLTEAKFKARTAPHNGKKVVVDGIEYTLKA